MDAGTYVAESVDSNNKALIVVIQHEVLKPLHRDMVRVCERHRRRAGRLAALLRHVRATVELGDETAAAIDDVLGEVW